MSWDGKIYDKYRIEHTDGTPLKGKKYFVLRLDSDDPVEAARVAAAMRAYKSEPRNCEVGDAADWERRFGEECDNSHICSDCPVRHAKTRMAIESDKGARCEFVWAQMPYAEKEGGAK